jgi:hypothetical protein
MGERVGWRIYRHWTDDKGRPWADVEHFETLQDAWAGYHRHRAKALGQVDLLELSTGRIIACSAWPDGWSPYDQPPRRHLFAVEQQPLPKESS